MMREFRLLFPAIMGLFVPFAASVAQEGTPFYYQQGYRPAQTVQTSSGNTVISQRSHTLQVPRAATDQYGQPGQIPGSFSPFAMGTMTPNGIGVLQQPDWLASLTYTRKYADFEFHTGVNSILKWNDMVINEIGLRLDHNFTIRNYNLFAFGEYRFGSVANDGLSMDYDLLPYDERVPYIGIFTISMGDQDGKTDYLRLGFGAKNVWDIAGWKLSPSIGYEVFKHNLQMSNHIYPNPGIYLPLMTDRGEYVFGDGMGNFYNIPINVTPEDYLYQVCLSPEDIAIVYTDPDGSPALNGGTLWTGPYDESMGYIPWGVGPSDCVIIGGDGAIKVGGVTHIYNTTWSGIYLGLEVEKQLTFADKLRFYLQVSMPHYYSEGIWPNRTDWQQSPSFTDEGSTGAYSYLLEMEYTYQLSDRLQFSLKADTNYFYVGKIGGNLYVAPYTTYLYDEATGQYVYTDMDGIQCDPYVTAGCFPTPIDVPAHTQKISDSLLYSKWQSFALHIGLKYAF